MKILLSQVSAQHVPTLLVAHALRPDRLVLLVPESMEDQAGWLIKALALGGLDYEAGHEQLRVAKASYIEHTMALLQEAYSRHPGAEWVVNLTSGTKPICLGTYEFFRDKGARMFYVSETDQTRAVDFSGKRALDLDYQVSVAEFLAGYGFNLQNARSMERAEKRAGAWFDLAARIAACHRETSVKEFLGAVLQLSCSRGGRDRGLDLVEEDGIALGGGMDLGDGTARRAGERASERAAKRVAKKVVHREVLREIWGDLSRFYGLEVSPEGGVLVGSLDRYAVRFLTGGWLEFFVWGLLRRLEDGGISDLHLGVSFCKIGPSSNRVQNEWDVAFMRDQSLYIVECKTGVQEQDPTGNETLYKIEAIKSQLNAIRIGSYLVTTASNVLDDEGRIKEPIANRAQIYDCILVTGDVIEGLAEMVLAGDPGLSGETARAFFPEP